MKRKLSLFLPSAIVAALAFASTAIPIGGNASCGDCPEVPQSTPAVAGVQLPEAKLNLELQDATVEDVLKEVRTRTGLKVDTRGRAATQRIGTFSVAGEEVLSALLTLAKQNGLLLIQPSTPEESWMLLAYTDCLENLQNAPLERREFTLRGMSGEAAARQVLELLTTDIGSITYHGELPRICVRDQPFVLEEVESRLRDIES